MKLVTLSDYLATLDLPVEVATMHARNVDSLSSMCGAPVTCTKARWPLVLEALDALTDERRRALRVTIGAPGSKAVTAAIDFLAPAPVAAPPLPAPAGSSE